MGFSSDVLTLERRADVCWVWLDRPKKHNSLNQELWTDLGQAMREISADDSIRVVVIGGRGKSFCAGIDHAALQTLSGSRHEQSSRAAANLFGLRATEVFQRSISSLAECPVPVIAAIQGACLGGGIDIATACDLRLAAADAPGRRCGNASAPSQGVSCWACCGAGVHRQRHRRRACTQHRAGQ